MKEQTDLRIEFSNQMKFYKKIACKYIIIPKPLYCNKNVLIQEFHKGKKLCEMEKNNKISFLISILLLKMEYYKINHLD